MTELERQLSKALENLSQQYRLDMSILENQISTLAQQVNNLAQQNKTLIEHYNKIADLLREELER